MISAESAVLGKVLLFPRRTAIQFARGFGPAGVRAVIERLDAGTRPIAKYRPQFVICDIALDG
jgi:hypothetical protein